MTKDEKLQRIQSRSWYHSIEIDEGVVTPGSMSLQTLRLNVQRLQLPASLEGLSVLDIGAWDGFYNFEAEKRGAQRVVACDLPTSNYFGFETAKELLRSRFEYRQGSVYELNKETIGSFDVVLLLGVLYHLRYALLALDRIRAACDGYLLLETHFLDNHFLLDDGRVLSLDKIDPRVSSVPLYRFYAANELNNDYSNWFSPNRRAIEEGLRTAGFEPQRLAEWGDRISYKATKKAALPEYMNLTYEYHWFV